MTFSKAIAPILAITLALGACSRTAAPGDGDTSASSGLFGLGAASPTRQSAIPEESNIFDLFDTPDPNVTVEVNKYIWAATLQILDFMPIQTVDPFTGVIVYGFGAPPGGSTAYRATVLIQDPALDARSLNLALSTRRGPVNAETARAVEDAILTRARALRIQDNRL